MNSCVRHLQRILLVGSLAAAATFASAQISESGGQGITLFYPGPTGVFSRDTRAKNPPKFGFSEDFRYTAHVDIPPGTDLYGTGEVAGPLRRNGRVTENWNSDVPGYTEANPSLYQSHPWVLAVRRDGTALGVLAETTYRCRIDLRNGIEFAADGPEFGVAIIEGENPGQVVKRLADLTGRMQLPPLWALGYHQCRWSYMSAEEALGIAGEFRKRHIPCDTIWFDIDYMDGFRIFTFNRQTFPDPKALNAKLHASGFHTVWMIDPGVKVDPGYAVYDSGVQQDVFVKSLTGRNVVGRVWPGDCLFPDFTREETLQWWVQQYQPWLSNGIDGVWNDMNEPSFFGVPTKTMPEEALHRGGLDTLSDQWAVPAGPHAEYHNLYGMFMVGATRQGLLRAHPDRRPFVLTRAGFLGYQQFAATWTGDNVTNWNDLHQAAPMVLNLGLSGQPFSGPDLPGFGGNGAADADEQRSMISRWFGMGAMMPFARGHAAKGTIRKEPWAFGPEVEETIRKSLWRRSILVPYLYTQFETAARTGLPVARPLFFADPKDLSLRSEDQVFLLGGDLAVDANTARDKPLRTLPKGWPELNLWAADPYLPHLYLRPGAILPLGPPREYTSQPKPNDLWLTVTLDAQGRASGTLYEDAGDGFGYRKGEFRRTQFWARQSQGTLRLTVKKAEGKWALPERTLHVEVLGTAHALSATVRLAQGSLNVDLLPQPYPEVGPGYRADFG